MKYSWLLFDADGTLFDFEKSQSKALEKTFDALGIDFQDKYHPIYRRVNKKIWDQREQDLISFEDVKTKRFEIFFKEINVNADHIQANDVYLNFLSQGSYLLDGAEELVYDTHLKYNLVLLTNGLTSVQKPRFANSPITKHFKEVIISEEVGFSKPGKEIFDLCFKMINMPQKSEVLMIGDNLTSDILGGFNYKIDTCWFNPAKQKNDLNIKPTYEIFSFEQLRNILII